MRRSTTIATATPVSPSPSGITPITWNHHLHRETIVNPGTHAAKRAASVLALYPATTTTTTTTVNDTCEKRACEKAQHRNDQIENLET